MTKRPHVQELLATCQKEWGRLAGIRPSADNRTCTLHFGGEEADEAAAFDEEEEPDPSLTVGELVRRAREARKARVVFNGQVVAESEGDHHGLDTALSFDGQKLAVARLVRDGASFHYEVDVNGVTTYRSEPLLFVYNFTWLDNERLAWYGWYKGKDGGFDEDRRGLFYFINGRDVTGSLIFEGVWGERSHHEFIVQEKGVRYTLRDDGSRAHERPACCDRLMCTCHERPDEPRPLMPEEVRSESGGVSVVFGDYTGEKFDGLEDGSGTRTYALNAARTRVGYVGIRYGGLAKLVGRVVSPLIERACNRSDNGKTLWWAWPLVLLFNPYMGVGTAAIEGSKRYHPVNQDRVWKRGYVFANDQFFTPADKLVVTAFASLRGGKAMIVIDEDEGPSFDAVYNVRYLDAEGCVCYLGRDGDRIYRVTVKTE